MRYQFVENVDRKPSSAISIFDLPDFEMRKEGRFLYVDVSDLINPASYRDKIFEFVSGFGYEPLMSCPVPSPKQS